MSEFHDGDHLRMEYFSVKKKELFLFPFPFGRKGQNAIAILRNGSSGFLDLGLVFVGRNFTCLKISRHV